ncbi:MULTISPECIES: ABC transporter permease [unclassified Ornithinimicrobium]|uniref:ABC transporter permease n=1 Tax=unclassified Ornithinimicrobium TaxID=2615080 RepID=UPI003853873A
MTTLQIMMRWLRTHRGGLLGWALGLGAASTMYLSFYSTVAKDQELLDQYMEMMPAEMMSAFGFDDIASPAGYAQSTVYGLIGTILLLIAGMTRGTRAIAGDEQSGALETEVTAAVNRRQVYTGRALGVTAFVLLLGLVVGFVTAAVNGPAGLDLPLVNIAAGVAALSLLGLVHALIALAVGAATGRPGVALAVAIVVAVLGFFGSNLGPSIMEGVERFAPYHWAFGNSPLDQGPDWAGLGLLVLLSLAAFVAGLLTFPRRDLGV